MYPCASLPYGRISALAAATLAAAAALTLVRAYGAAQTGQPRIANPLPLRIAWEAKGHGGAKSIQAGDLTGDGTPEIVFATDDGAVMALDSAGRFLHCWNPPAAEGHLGRTPAPSVLLIDVDGNRGLEIVLTGRNVRAVSLARPDAPIWARPTSTAVALCAADVNGDGLPEIACRCDSELLILDRKGGVLARSALPPGGPPSVRAGDLNGDGRQELVLANRYAIEAVDGTGARLWQYGVPSGMAPGGSLARNPLLVTDVDGDGRAEVAVGLYAVHLLGGSGKLRWRGPSQVFVRSLLCTDLDADGRLEIVAGADGSVQFLTAEGTPTRTLPLKGFATALAAAKRTPAQTRSVVAGSFLGCKVCAFDSEGGERWAWQAREGVRALCVADLNGDGADETLVAGGSVSALDADGGSLWSFPSGGQTHVAAADTDGDGSPEVIAADSAVRVYEADGRLRWERNVGLAAAWVAAGDVNGDGKAEIAVAGWDKRVVLFSGDGTPLWDRETRSIYGKVAIGACRDGTGLVVRGDEMDATAFTPDGTRVWTNTGRGAPYHLAMGDIDQDGHVETILGTFNGWVVVVDCHGSEKWSLKIGEGWIAGIGDLAMGDVDGDGKREIVASVNRRPDEEMVILGCDGQVKKRFVTQRVEASIRWRDTIALADLNGDRRLEIALSTQWSLQGFDGSGKRLFSHRKREANQHPLAAAGDLDRDGRPEIISAPRPTMVVDARGGLRYSQIWPHNVIVSLAVADLDRDGADEIVIGSYGVCVVSGR